MIKNTAQYRYLDHFIAARDEAEAKAYAAEDAKRDAVLTRAYAAEDEKRAR